MYCILGADGFIGRNLVKDLGGVGYGRKDLNLLDSRAVDEFFNSRSFDVVIHCAVIGGSRLKEDDADVFLKNIKMFENVARHSGKFKRFVWFSSGASFLDSPYGFSKYICEKLAIQIPNCQVFRIYGCYGKDELPTRFISSCLRGPVHVDDRYFDFFWVGDISKVIKNFTICDSKIRDLVYKNKFKLSDVARMNNADILSITDDPKGDYVGEFSPDLEIEDRDPVLVNESL